MFVLAAMRLARKRVRFAEGKVCEVARVARVTSDMEELLRARIDECARSRTVDAS